MGSDLVWRPIAKKKQIGGITLKNIVADTFRLPIIIGNSHADFFRGLRAAGVEGAEEILQLIAKHGEIQLDITG